VHTVSYLHVRIKSDCNLSGVYISDKYKICKGDEAYFVTYTIFDWIKILKDIEFKYLIIDSIKYFQKQLGLIVYAYCKASVSGIQHDSKIFSAKAIIKY